MPIDRPEGTFEAGAPVSGTGLLRGHGCRRLRYHANYLRFAERARTEMLRRLGMEQSRLAAEDGILFVMRRCNADFVAPARLDDSLGLGEPAARSARRLDRSRTVLIRDGFDLVRLRVGLACMRDGRVARLPAPVRAALAEFSGNTWSEDGKQRG